MLDLGLAVACSVATAMLLKLVEVRGMDRAAVLAANYVVAAGLAVALGGGGGAALPPGAALLGAGTGALFLAGFYAFGAAIRHAGVALATGAMRLSVAVPVVGAWLLFADAPTALQGAGLALAAAAFTLMARPAEQAVDRPPATTAAWLALVFAIGGAVDLALGSYARLFGGITSEPSFLAVAFGASATLAVALVALRAARGARPSPSDLPVGLAVGLLNYGSVAFLVRAAGALPAPVVFPTSAIGIMTGAALLGVVFWRERLGRLHVGGLVVAGVALALLWGGAAEAR